MNRKRRTLALTTESSRHPFRMSLPPHVFAIVEEEPQAPRSNAIQASDWRGFFAAYCATFVAVMVFIA